jgi:hypothetical protein
MAGENHLSLFLPLCFAPFVERALHPLELRPLALIIFRYQSDVFVEGRRLASFGSASGPAAKHLLKWGFGLLDVAETSMRTLPRERQRSLDVRCWHFAEALLADPLSSLELKRICGALAAASEPQLT